MKRPSPFIYLSDCPGEVPRPGVGQAAGGAEPSSRNEVRVVNPVESMTVQELLDLGCRWWDKATRLMLLPEAVFRQLPNGTQLRSITGRTVTKGRDPIDDDTRFGLMAYGLFVKKGKHEEKSEK